VSGMLNPEHRPCRGLHIIGGMVRGGAENWIMSLLRKANSDILEMDICTTTKEKQIHDDEVIALGRKLIRCELKPVFTFPKRLAQVIRDGDYDVIHSHLWLFSGLVLKAAHHCGVPVRIAYCHTTRSKPLSLYRSLYSWYMRCLIGKYATHRLGCASEAMVALFGDKWQNMKNARVLYCSIDVDLYHPDQLRRISKSDFGLADDAIVVGHIGDFRLAKNHTFFLDIAAELVKIQPRAHFFFAGAGELKQKMEEKAKRLGLGNRVIFAGVRDDVPQLLMYLFDVLLFPSVYEGMPLVLVEAASAGLRTVCSDAITPEATNVLPELFTRLSLDLPAKEWAVAVVDAIKKGPIPREYSYKRVKDSHFSVDYSLRELMSIYGCGVKG
jgi:glycosyltransferase involved in cell wall biosynthesis